MNLFLSDGNDIVVACYTFDRDRYEGADGFNPPEEEALRVWYTTGHSYGVHSGEWRMVGATDDARSVIIASEPLTRDHSTWHAVPLQHLVYVRRAGEPASWTAGDAAGGSPTVEVVPLDVG